MDHSLIAGTASNPLNPYNLREPLKIPDVMGQQRKNVIGQHGGYDIGILLAPDFVIPH